jgi:excisionase family DNA binding protein
VKLLTLEQAADLLGAVNARTLRARIRRGELPAVKTGRAYLVSAEDVARLYTPMVRVPLARPGRETPTQRAERQLREAGIG